MNANNLQAGFRPVRHDRLLQEREHDAYKIKGKLHEPSICLHCGAVFHQGRWQWGHASADALAVTCPACHRLHDHFPAGFVTLKGSFFQEHRQEIMNLVHNEEKREKAEHPLKRIMAIKESEENVLVTTTDIYLARSIGDALQHAYKGKLEYHYNEGQNLLRVEWAH